MRHARRARRAPRPPSPDGRLPQPPRQASETASSPCRLVRRMRRWRNIPFVQKMGPERMCLPFSCAYPLAGGAKAAIVAPKTSFVGEEDGKEGNEQAGGFCQTPGPRASRGEGKRGGEGKGGVVVWRSGGWRYIK